MYLLKYLTLVFIFSAIVPVFSCSDTDAELTINNAIDTFKKSGDVITVTVKNIIKDKQVPTSKEKLSSLSSVKKEIDRLKKELSRTKDQSKFEKLQMELDGFETDYSIYLVGADLDFKKTSLGYDGSYDGSLSVDTIVIESYKGKIEKGTKFSLSSLRRPWGLCHDIKNNYLYTAKVGDLLVLYLGEGSLEWEVFNNDKELNEKMFKVKNGVRNKKSFLSEILSLFI